VCGAETELLLAASACRQPRLIVVGPDDLLLKCKRTRTFLSTVLFLFKLSSIRQSRYRQKERKKERKKLLSVALKNNCCCRLAEALFFFFFLGLRLQVLVLYLQKKIVCFFTAYFLFVS
jgi:hypothetical protein